MRFPLELNDRVVRRCALLLVVAHILLGTLYSLVVPLWEAYDEWGHYAYVQYVANHLAPPPGGRQLIEPDDETKQPPLYYLLTGLPTFWLQPHEPIKLHLNPYGLNGTGNGGSNAAVHGPDEAFPFTGIVLGVHVTRWLGVVAGGLAVWLTFLMARLLFPAQPAIVLGATALHAFAPQFLFMSAVVNNDGLAVTVSSLILYLTLRAMLRPARPRDLLWPFMALMLGAATKFNILALAPAVLLGAGVGGWKLARTRGWRLSRRALAGTAVGLLALLLLIRLYVLDLLSRQSADVPIVGLLSRLPSLLMDPFSPSFGWQVLPDAFDYGFTTFWAAFGWGNIAAADSVYTVLSVLCWLALLGLVIGAVRFFSAGQRAGLAWLGFALASVIAAAAYFALSARWAYALSGRYVLTALSAVSLMIAAGIAGLCPRPLRAPALGLLALGFAWWGLRAPFDSIMPVYALPPTLPAAQADSVPNPLGARFGDEIELVGYELQAGEARQGGAMPVTLYWRLLKPTSNDYTVGLHLTGSGEQPVGGLDSYPGGGNFATSLWTPGVIIQDSYLVPVQTPIGEQDTGRLVISLYLGKGGKPLTVSRPDAPARNAVTVGRFRLLPAASIAAVPSHPAHFELGTEIALTGYDIAAQGATARLKLYWQALKSPSDDYTVFVHLTNGDQIVAQQDHQPRGGKFPTGLWRPGDIVVDETELAIPANTDLHGLRLWTGMYRAATLERLAAVDAGGHRLPDDRIPLELP